MKNKETSYPLVTKKDDMYYIKFSEEKIAGCYDATHLVKDSDPRIPLLIIDFNKRGSIVGVEVMILKTNKPKEQKTNARKSSKKSKKNNTI